MPNGASIHRPWPDWLKASTAAAMLDMSPSTWRVVWPILAARHGLKVYRLGGVKFQRANVLEVVDRLADLGLDITVDKAAGVVRIGQEEFPIGPRGAEKQPAAAAR